MTVDDTVYLRVSGSGWTTHGIGCSVGVHREAGTYFELSADQPYFEDVQYINYKFADPITYTFKFSTIGYRHFQTFGNNDTCLVLTDEDGRELVSGRKEDSNGEMTDNKGYGKNDFANYYVYPNKKYILKVYYYGDRSTNIKTTVTSVDVFENGTTSFDEIKTVNAVNSEIG